MKKLTILIAIFLLTLSVAACAKQPQPEQISQAKAFTDKGFIVKNNLKYEVKEYNYGRVIGDNVVETGTYYNIRLEVTNVGSSKETISADKIKLETQGNTLKPEMEFDKQANNADFLKTELVPNQKETGWIVFKSDTMPTTSKLYIADAIIEIQ